MSGLSAARGSRFRLRPKLLGHSAFQICGYVGLALAIALTQTLAIATGRSPWIMVALTALAVAVFFALAVLTKFRLGVERLTYFHHLIAVLGAALLLLRILGQPILAYLDLVVLGVGVFTACGRVGCMLAGCCHGRPYRWGLRYGPVYARSAVSPYLVGVRLFPVQPAEALLTACITVIGAAIVLTEQPPGMVLACYLLAYSVGRFTLEFLRGDATRRFWRGLSEAQWTALLISAIVGTAVLTGILPLAWWYVLLAAVGIAAAATLLWPAAHGLRGPDRVHKLAAALYQAAAPSNSTLRIASTDWGLTISSGAIADTSGIIYHYSLSRPGAPLDESEVHILGALIAELRHLGEDFELQRGDHGVYHVLIRTSDDIGV